MAGFSGKFGTARPQGGADVVELLGWDFDPKVAVPKWASNSTSGVKYGVVGVKDSSGKIDVKMDDTVKLPFRPGTVLTLDMHVDATNNNFIRVIAIIESMPVSTKINPDGEPISITYNFQGISAPIYFGLFAPTGSSSGL